jgi:Xaa-Pro aminopeptidase
MDSRRKEIVEELIRRSGVVAFLFWRPDELVMMLGYMPLWGVSVLMYKADGQAVLFVPEAEPEDVLPRNIQVRKYPWGVLNGSDPWEMLYLAINEELIKSGLGAGSVSFIKSIGGSAPCRMAGEQPPLPANLIKRLEQVSSGGWKDATKELLGLYDEKMATDIAGLEITHSLTARAVDVFYRQVSMGHTEAKLAALVEAAVLEVCDGGRVGFARAWAMVQSGEHSADAGKFNRSTGKVIEKGELVVLEMGVCVNGYWADITRTAVVGPITDMQQRMYDAVRRAQEAAFKMLRPGVFMRDVDGAARRIIADAGFESCFPHALGHQTGFRYHDPGDSLSPYSTGVLKEGMVITIEPGVYGPSLGGGLRLEDNALITAEGYRILSDYPRDVKGDNYV